MALPTDKPKGGVAGKAKESRGLSSPEPLQAGDSNSGMVSSKAHMGQTIIETFGNDRSFVVGSSEDERGGGMGGGPTNLSHSLSGASVSAAPTRGGKAKL